MTPRPPRSTRVRSSAASDVYKRQGDNRPGFAAGKPHWRATPESVSYTHLRAHETVLDLVCRLLLEKKKNNKFLFFFFNDTATTEIYTRKIVGSVRCV